MTQYRKKPVVIEAVRVSATLAAARNTWSGLEPWVIDAYEEGILIFAFDSIDIITLEGVMHASKGDWIIRGVKGELYPCKPDIFAATYDAVEPTPADIANEAAGWA